MNPVNSNILIGKKDAAFFAANPTLVLLDGQLLYNENTGELFIGDGVTQLNALSAINSGFTPSGTNTQYIAGDGSYINFPTDVSYFNNDAGYLDSGDIGVSVQPYDSNTTLLGNGTAGDEIVLTTSSNQLTSLGLNAGESIRRNALNTAYEGFTALTSGDIGVTVQGYSANTTLLGNSTTGSGNIVLDTSPTFTTSILTPNVTGISGNLVFTNAAQSSGAITNFTFTAANHTAQTASTNIPTVSFNLGTLQRNTGAVTTQHGFLINSPTYSFVGASTITEAATLSVTAPTAGVNAIITNSYSASFNGGIIVRDSTFGQAIIRQMPGNSPTGIWLGQITPSGTNYSIISSFNALSTYLNSRETTGIAVNSDALFVCRGLVSSGASTSFTFTKPNNTGQTASTNIQGFLFTTGSRQWATGAITTQEEIRITSPTYSFVGASTITNAYSLFVNAPTAGTNATITNNYAAGFGGDIRIDMSATGTYWRFGGHSASSFAGALYHLATATAISTTNYTLRADQTNLELNSVGAAGYVSLQTAANDRLKIIGLVSSGASTTFTFTTPANTGQTASTNIPNFRVNGSTKTWAAGTITNQYWNYFTANTAAFASASTITNSYGLYVEAATAGTNATITNNYAAGFGGNVNIVSGHLRVNGTQVVTSRDTGWTAFTNTTNKATAYDTATVTLQQLAERVAAIQAALTTHGLIGA